MTARSTIHKTAARVIPQNNDHQNALRGDRLLPARHSRLYWHLTCLRRAYQEIVDAYITGHDYGELLDYGCGNMPYRSLFEPHVGAYRGCDLPGNALADLTLTGDGRLPVEDGSADVVLSSQVLEHVPDPAGYLTECRRALRPEGLLILSTHGTWPYHPDPTDYWRWTCEGLKKLLKDSGFMAVECRGVMAAPSYAVQVWQDYGAVFVPRFVRPAFYWMMQSMIQIVDRLCPTRLRDHDATVYIAVARRVEDPPQPSNGRGN